MISGSLPQLLIGKIANDRNKDEEGWHRRRISLEKGKTGAYPQFGEAITLIDTSNNPYTHEFVKGFKNDRVYTSKPAKLKSWFVAHYEFSIMEEDEVYLEYRGYDECYNLYTSTEWKIHKP